MAVHAQEMTLELIQTVPHCCKPGRAWEACAVI